MRIVCDRPTNKYYMVDRGGKKCEHCTFHDGLSCTLTRCLIDTQGKCSISNHNVYISLTVTPVVVAGKIYLMVDYKAVGDYAKLLGLSACSCDFCDFNHTSLCGEVSCAGMSFYSKQNIALPLLKTLIPYLL